MKPLDQKPLPNDVYYESEKFIRDGYTLLAMLRWYEDCPLAESQGKRLKQVLESVVEQLNQKES